MNKMQHLLLVLYFFCLINEGMEGLKSPIGKELWYSKLHRLISHIPELKKYQPCCFIYMPKL